MKSLSGNNCGWGKKTHFLAYVLYFHSQVKKEADFTIFQIWCHICHPKLLSNFLTDEKLSVFSK